MSNLDFERIYLNSSKAHGRFRLAPTGLGWKPAAVAGSATKQEPYLLPSEELSSATWSRASRGYELRVQTKNRGVLSFDGFDTQDFNTLKNELQRSFNVLLDHREHSMRGWNWGDLDLTRNEVQFHIQGKPAFELPYSNIHNTNMAGKNEVTVEMAPGDNKQVAGDEVVEMRFYIPGVEENLDENAEETEEVKTKAAAFHEQLKEKADIGQYSGDAIASFTDVLFLTPRGRFDIDMYASSLRLRGKTYDHKIQFRSIERIFSLPKPDEIQHLMVLQINPPLRQGQTPYPFLVLQIVKDEELELEINLDDEEFQKYDGRLHKKYDQQTHLVLSHVFRGLTERRIIVPGSFQITKGQAAVACSLKVNEGYLYFLEKCFLFLPKPTVYIPYADVSHVDISRVENMSANRTFDLEVNLRSGASHKFANVSKEEQSGIIAFLKEKQVRVKSEEAEQKAMLAALANESDSDDGDINMGSADEDESPDEDFQDDGSDDDDADDDDLASDEDMSDADGEPPAKKAKI